MENNIEKIKKINDAESDINELTDVLNSIESLKQNGVDVFNRIFNKLDYKPYIFILTNKYGLRGNLSFEQLDFKMKIEVLKMLRDSICAYVKKEIGEEILDKILKKRSVS